MRESGKDGKGEGSARSGGEMMGCGGVSEPLGITLLSISATGSSGAVAMLEAWETRPGGERGGNDSIEIPVVPATHRG